MGNAIALRCPKCGREETIYFGIGYFYPRDLKEARQAGLDGKLGSKWKELLLSHPEYSVAADRALYYCKDCGTYENSLSYDLFENEKDIVMKYLHQCPKCNKSMKKYKSINYLKLRCPDCNETMIKDLRIIMWD